MRRLHIFLLPVATILLLACASAFSRNVQVVHIGMVHPTIIAIEIEVGAIERGEIIPYEFAPATDEIDDHPPTESGDRWVRRNGTIIGAVLGPEKNWLRTFDTYVEPEENLSLSRLDDITEYSIAPRVIFAGSKSITAVHRKSTPIGMAMD